MHGFAVADGIHGASAEVVAVTQCTKEADTRRERGCPNAPRSNGLIAHTDFDVLHAAAPIVAADRQSNHARWLDAGARNAGSRGAAVHAPLERARGFAVARRIHRRILKRVGTAAGRERQTITAFLLPRAAVQAPTNARHAGTAVVVRANRDAGIGCEIRPSPRRAATNDDWNRTPIRRVRGLPGVAHHGLGGALEIFEAHHVFARRQPAFADGFAFGVQAVRFGHQRAVNPQPRAIIGVDAEAVYAGHRRNKGAGLAHDEQFSATKRPAIAPIQPRSIPRERAKYRAFGNRQRVGGASQKIIGDHAQFIHRRLRLPIVVHDRLRRVVFGRDRDRLDALIFGDIAHIFVNQTRFERHLTIVRAEIAEAHVADKLPHFVRVQIAADTPTPRICG